MSYRVRIYNSCGAWERIMVKFSKIRARAEKRKGGAEALKRLLPPKPDAKALARLGNDRILAEMTKRVFCAGFAWSVITTRAFDLAAGSLAVTVSRSIKTPLPDRRVKVGGWRSGPRQDT
jgi:hypothetical protein